MAHARDANASPEGGRAPSLRKPPWLKKKVQYTDENHLVKSIIHDLGLNTVCRSARCPNLSECFHRKRATFMILGDACTRACTFCAVDKAGSVPLSAPSETEPAMIAEAVKRLDLRYVVVTSVTRDDLGDGGSGQFARTIGTLRRLPFPVKVEVLTPDFLGREQDIRRVVDADPDVYNHNVETVRRLYPQVRPAASYERSLALLRFVKDERPDLFVKSGLMVGMGERPGEVVEVLEDLRRSGCDAVTIGQYLRPRRWNLPVSEYVEPGVFEFYRAEGERLGFSYVAAGPYVRSSYMAHEGYKKLAGS